MIESWYVQNLDLSEERVWRLKNNKIYIKLMHC